MTFDERIFPFFWVEHQNSFSVCLNAEDYKPDIFRTREDEGFQGDGYDWASLANVFLQEQKRQFISVVKFDPEAGMFSAYSSNEDALKEFIISFKEACEDDILIQDIFSRAELD